MFVLFEQASAILYLETDCIPTLESYFINPSLFHSSLSFCHFLLPKKLFTNFSHIELR